jgi:hypothetical protein
MQNRMKQDGDKEYWVDKDLERDGCYLFEDMYLIYSEFEPQEGKKF